MVSSEAVVAAPEEPLVQTGLRSSSSSGGGSGSGSLWEKMKEKYHLVDFHALPHYLRDNEYILSHYRADWPLRPTLLSIFSLHNETLNIWTHLAGFILFLCLTIYTAAKLPRVVTLPCMPSIPNVANIQEMLASISSSLPHLHLPRLLSNCLPEGLVSTNKTQQCILQGMRDEVADLISPFTQKPTTRWPFFVFLGGAMFCLFASSTCHLLYCHSRRIAYIMLRLDYAGIAVLISSSFYPPVYYSFMCEPFLRNVYLTIITCMGLTSAVVSLVPVFQNPEFRNIRAGLFFGMGVSGVFPIAHKLIIHRDEPAALYTTAFEVAMGLFYGLGALIYAARIPERWKPGKFDIAGQSHQLFHVLVVAGAYTHYLAGLRYLKWRDAKGCPS